MKAGAILFVDVDDSEVANYNYREMHFSAAKELGLACITVVHKDHQYLERIVKDSDRLLFADKITAENILGLIETQTDYEIKAIFCHAGHASPYGQIGTIVAEVADHLGLKYSSMDSITACNNKFVMRHILMSKGIRSARFALCNDVESIIYESGQVGFPLIVKPPFGAGSAFIKKCHNIDEVISHYQHFTTDYQNSHMADFYGIAHEIKLSPELVYQYIPGKSILLEEYIEGIEGSVECIAYKNNVYPVLINEKLILEQKNATILENLLITPPVSFTALQIEQIKKYSIECIAALDLDNAVIHFEFRLAESGPVVIEINPRLGGLYVNSAFSDIAGIDPYKLYILMLLEASEVEELVKQGLLLANKSSTAYSMLAIYPENSGYFKGFNGVDYLRQHPQISKYETYTEDTYVNAEVEENYLLKCWAKVHDKNDAQNLYHKILTNVTPIISQI